jgi:P pilus assembly chaperone PapD
MFKLMVLWMTVLATGLCANFAAAGACSLEVSPLTVEIRMEPGRTCTGTISVQNMGDGAEHLRAYCQDWTLKPDGVVVFLAAGKLPGSASPWTEVVPAEFDLEPGQTRQVRYTLQPPAEVSGEIRTAVIFEAGARAVSAPGAPSRLVPRIGTILYAQVGPASSPRARVAQLDLDRSGGELAIENLGPAHLRFTGQLEFRDATGALVRRSNLTPFVVLPAPFNRHLQKLPPEALAGLPTGHYQVTTILDYGGDSLLGARTEIDLAPESPLMVSSAK